MYVRRHVVVLVTAAVALSGAGCGPSKHKPVKVSGTVILDGKAVAGAAIQFVPEGNDGAPAYGETKEDGGFRLTTHNDGDGALPGNYKVIVTWEEPPPPMFRGGGEKGPSREQMQKAVEAHREKMKKLRPSAIPAIYSDPGKTPLRQAVPPKGKVELNLDSKAR
jgi:hypothetical protein